MDAEKAKELELRLAAQEFITGKFLAELLVKDRAIRALIATHPQPAAVKAVFQILIEDAQSKLPDNGFAVGMPVEMAQKMRKDISSEAEKLMSAFGSTT